ncbi:cation-transporting P-type ATPase [Aporhodopirellula aestuarii]|uniref:Cation-transporting P-type ATPase n=1 Tax=Aporhodopirellula aestuarii TaxID=2950107 RepID=A0ABT0TZ98_9BACT|nr:cation-transporting P-type ATPase [Aporhodopirellula aestuarii]MCM2369850.1 cation-transporting P-type ATPase [Aporhodopirellula aestuarii]
MLIRIDLESNFEATALLSDDSRSHLPSLESFADGYSRTDAVEKLVERIQASTSSGIRGEEAAERLATGGANTLQSGDVVRRYQVLVRQLKDVLIQILLIAGSRVHRSACDY